MTDSPTPAEPGPVDPDAALASAHVDGEAAPEEVARVEEPAVQAHVAAFERVADQVRDVLPAPAGLVDDQVARALEAFDPDARVVPLAARGTSGRWWERVPLGAVAAAFFIVVLVGAIGLAVQSGGDDDETAATAELESSDDGADSSDASATAEAGIAQDSAEGADGADETTALEAAGDSERQAYESYDELAGAIREELAALSGSDAPVEESSTTMQDADGAGGQDGIDPCGAVELLGLDRATVVLVRSLVVTPDEVTVVVHDAEDGRRLVVVDEASCTVVLDRIL
jgi:hypothetical protein